MLELVADLDARSCGGFLLSHLVRYSPHVRTEINDERLMVLGINAHIALQVCRHDPGCCPPMIVGQVTCCLKPCKSFPACFFSQLPNF